MTDIDIVRKRLEEVANDFRSRGETWCWDETKMHLTISDAQGNPIATLHVEMVN